MAGRSVGLDGVVAQQANYARSGFASAHRTLRFTGVPRLPASDRTAPVGPGNTAAILALDREATGLDRAGFMKRWARPGPNRMVRVHPRGGFGMLRRCVSGWKLGPLLAADPGAAEEFLSDLAAGAPSEPVMLDIPELNAAGLALARRAGLALAFETARMWTGPPSEADLGRTFGVATLELG